MDSNRYGFSQEPVVESRLVHKINAEERRWPRPGDKKMCQHTKSRIHSIASPIISFMQLKLHFIEQITNHKYTQMKEEKKTHFAIKLLCQFGLTLH